MNSKIYTKKIIMDNELSTPEARAERLKRVRNLANLSRKEMCDGDDININTYKGWELARFGGLPFDGAGKVVSRIAKEGVICSVEWLLYGQAPVPSLTIETALPSEKYDAHSISSNLIEREFLVYKEFYENAVLEKVEDDSLLPQFKKGDYLAGVKKYGEEIKFVIDRLCIIQTIDGRRLIRYIKEGVEQESYSLFCVNPLSSARDLAILNVKLIYAAPISRHYIIIENNL